jgi:hypothetical protein
VITRLLQPLWGWVAHMPYVHLIATGVIHIEALRASFHGQRQCGTTPSGRHDQDNFEWCVTASATFGDGLRKESTPKGLNSE